MHLNPSDIIILTGNVLKKLRVETQGTDLVANLQINIKRGLGGHGDDLVIFNSVDAMDKEKKCLIVRKWYRLYMVTWKAEIKNLCARKNVIDKPPKYVRRKPGFVPFQSPTTVHLARACGFLKNFWTSGTGSSLQDWSTYLLPEMVRTKLLIGPEMISTFRQSVFNSASSFAGLLKKYSAKRRNVYWLLSDW